MPKTVFVPVEFKSPYHVGWRTAEPLIEGLTLHRALVSASALAGGACGDASNIVSELRVSSMLPLAEDSERGCYKLLAPLPPVPSRIQLKKKRLRWATLRALVRLAGLAERAPPYIVDLDESRRTLVVEPSNRVCNLHFTGEVVHECDETIKTPPSILRSLEVHVNRMDRSTSAADVFRVAGYMPMVKVGVVVEGGIADCCVELLRLLGELGIGGLRSRGFGRFEVSSGELCDDDLKLVSSNPSSGHVVLLGSYPLDRHLVDVSKSMINRRLLSGYSGPPHDAHVLPHMNYMGAGSILSIRGQLVPVVVQVKTSHLGAVIPFIPVLAGGPS